MAGAIQAIVGALKPGEWKKDTSAEENLKTFNLYMDDFQRWLDIGEMDNFSDKQKWSLLIATEAATSRTSSCIRERWRSDKELEW